MAIDRDDFNFISSILIDKRLFYIEGSKEASDLTEIPNPAGVPCRLWVIWRREGSDTWMTGQNAVWQGEDDAKLNKYSTLIYVRSSSMSLSLTFGSSSSSDIFEYKIIGTKL